VTTLSQIAGAVALARRRYYTDRPESRRRLTKPVISVGNLTVGGSGKTPLVAYLAARLLQRGWRPSILSRGYGRAYVADGVVVVSDGRTVLADLARSGDEPLMLARQLPGVAVLVSPNRHLAGRLAEARFGCDVHLLDDGFQHFVLERDIDLLVVGPDDVSRPLVLPFGRLREPLEVARAADAVLWTGEGDAADAAARLGVAHGFQLTHEAGAFTSAPFGGPLPAPGDRVIAMAAIARPERFVAALARSGFNVASTMFLRDHHRYTPADLARAEREMRDANAVCIVTTEKDMVRLLPLRPLPFPLAWRRLTTRVEPAETFDAWLDARLARGTARQEPAA